MPNTSSAAPRFDRPVYVLLSSSALSENLARELRGHGVRARSFVNLDVLRNAARGQAPAAVLLDLAALPDPGLGPSLAAELRESAGTPVPLLYLGEDDDFSARLNAVRAAGSGYYPLPVNLSWLVYQLRSQTGLRSQERLRVLTRGAAKLASALCARGLDAHELDPSTDLLEALGDQDALVLTDGAGDAMEIATAVRQTGTLHALPIIVLSTDKQRLDEAAAAAGVDALLGLSVAPEDLAAVIHSRVTRARALRAAYRYSSRRDPGTGLFQLEVFDEALRLALREPERRGGLLYLQLGPVAGGRDRRLLAAGAAILRETLPARAVAAAVAADAIAVLLPGADADEVDAAAQALTAHLRRLEPGYAGATAAQAPRLGVTLLGGTQRAPEEVLERARAAAALQDGPARPQSPPAQLDHWRARTRRALEAGDFRLVYQPIASLGGQPTPYYEVFLRMLDADGGDILPQEFLPGAERAGLAPAIDRWVIDRALHVLEEQSLQHKPVLFLKLCADTAGDPSFPAWLRDRLARSNVDPQRLVLQLTQRTAATRQAETHALAEALRRLGCQFALEHLGGDENTQELVKGLAPNFVKLSPALTQDIGGNTEHQAQVQALAGLCRSVEAHTVAALVQDALNLSVLWRCGVEFIQGYFMQEPVDIFGGEETKG